MRLECDLDNIDEALERLGELDSKCPIKTYRMAKEMVDTGKAKNENQAGKLLAEELGEPLETIRSRIKRGKKTEVGSPKPKKKMSILNDYKRILESKQTAFFKALHQTKTCDDMRDERQREAHRLIVMEIVKEIYDETYAILESEAPELLED